MGEARCSDVVFGEMNYKHRWYKCQNIEMFGRTWEITVAAKAYAGKAITKEQQKSYSLFTENERKYVDLIAEELKKYINWNIHELAEDWVSARKIENIEELALIVTPRTLLFKQDGTTVMLFDCAWDIENGMGVKIIPEVTAGVQDLFL